MADTRAVYYLAQFWMTIVLTILGRSLCDLSWKGWGRENKDNLDENREMGSNGACRCRGVGLIVSRAVCFLSLLKRGVVLRGRHSCRRRIIFMWEEGEREREREIFIHTYRRVALEISFLNIQRQIQLTDMDCPRAAHHRPAELFLDRITSEFKIYIKR